MTARTFVLACLAVPFLASPAVLAGDLPPVDPAISTMSNDDLVMARQNAMKVDGMLLRRLRDLTGEDAVAAASEVLQNFVNFPAQFRAGATNDKSHALPIIWEQWDQFNAIFEQGQLAADRLVEAAKSGDTVQSGDAYRALSHVCFECHQAYRAR